MVTDYMENSEKMQTYKGLYLDEIMVPKYARGSYLSLLGYHGI